MHASKNQYLIKNRTTYGNWDMPMNFLLKENGASCRTGCHTELKYDRMNPFKYGDIADNDSTDIEYVTETGDTITITNIVQDSLIVAREDKDMIIDSLQSETDTLIVLIVDPEDDPDIESTERDSLIVAREDTDPVIDNIQSETDTLSIDTDQENQITNAIDAFNKIKSLRIHFKYAKTEIAKNADDKILILLEFMDTYPDVILEVGGHTDSKGTYEYNRELSRKRAEAVKRLLKSKGILSERIEIKAYSESYPISSNVTEEGRAKNRRVEFKLKKGTY